MKILTQWLRAYLPSLAVSDSQLAEDLTLRGIAVEGVHDPGNDGHGRPRGHVFEMDITTNRVDAMNHYGVAREAAAIYGLPLAPLRAPLTASPAPAFPVRIDPSVEHLCGRFTARVLRGVTIAPSTGTVQSFFELLGQKPISNAVDASNFTLLGMGHPTHAFDLDRIEGEILVRFARSGERLRLLDGTERVLAADDLVIADRARALSLAGVMGGMDSSITLATRNLLVEAAWFDPATIRRSARRHLLHTDASHRFERGADFNAAPLANDLVCMLILASGGGHAEGELVDLIIPEAELRTSRRPPVTLSTRDVQRQLGATLDDTAGHSALTPDLVRRVLTALGCSLLPTPAAASANAARTTLHARQDSAPDSVFSVALPSWRLDLDRSIDLVEEVARVFGYNRFRDTLPVALPVVEHVSARAEAALRARLLALGFSESISSSFAGTPDSELFAPVPTAAALTRVSLENPLSEEVSNLRPSLVPGMLAMLAHNLNRDVDTVRLFEQGHIFATPAAQGDGPIDEVRETLSLALGLTSANAAPTPLHRAADAAFFELKGAIESLVGLFAAVPANASQSFPQGTGSVTSRDSIRNSLTFTTNGTPAWLEPGRAAVAMLDGESIARFGELAQAEAARRKLRQPVFLAEVDLTRLLAYPLRQPIARELSRFQAVERDFSFVFPDATTWQAVSAAISALELPDLRSITPIEIFRDSKGTAIPRGHYSLLVRTVFQSSSRTLTEDELSAGSARILKALTALGGTHRG